MTVMKLILLAVKLFSEVHVARKTEIRAQGDCNEACADGRSKICGQILVFTALSLW